MTNQQLTPPPIIPREKMNFGLDGDIARFWLDNDPFKTRFFDALSTLFPVGERFFITREVAGKAVRYVTPLFLVLVLVELSDVIFAVDSIPAIFAITTDPFIVLTSNIFAILGLRAMYFMLAGMADRFSLLKYGLALVLVFIGTKMLLIDIYPIPVPFSLGVVVVIITTSIVLSLRRDARQRAGEALRQN